MTRRIETVQSSPASWLDCLEGDAGVLLIAPHGGRAGDAARATLHPKVNDLETADITRQLARRLNAPALINTGMDRNELDCNRLSQLTDQAPWLLAIIADRVAQLVKRHGRATVLLIHGWNIIEPRVDLGLGARETAGRLHPPAGAYVSASDEFIHGPVSQLAARLRAAEILPTFGLRYPGAARQNLLQAFTPRHRDSEIPALSQLAAMASDGLIDALQLEMSVAVRLHGPLRDRSLASLAETFSHSNHGTIAHRPTLSVAREALPRAPKRDAVPSAAMPPLRIGIEFYDPRVKLGAMTSFDFGPNAAGGRIMILFERRRVALFTAEGKPRRLGTQLSLGPLSLNAEGSRGHLRFVGPAVVVDDGAAYLSVERALAEGTIDSAVEVACSLDLDGSASSFGQLLAGLEGIIAKAYRPGAPPDELIQAVPPYAAFGRLSGTVVVAGKQLNLNATARIGVSFTGLGPQKFLTRRMLWACSSNGGNYQAFEARALELDASSSHRIARALRQGQWSDCTIGDFELETSSPYAPPERISATLAAATGQATKIDGTAETFMTLSRPGPDGIRIHSSLGFAAYKIESADGVGMYEYSRRVPDHGGDQDSENED